MFSKFSINQNPTTDQQKKRDFAEELKDCNTMAEFLKVCADFYDLDNAKLGPISKLALVNNIDKIIVLSGAKLK